MKLLYISQEIIEKTTAVTHEIYMWIVRSKDHCYVWQF